MTKKEALWHVERAKRELAEADRAYDALQDQYGALIEAFDADTGRPFDEPTVLRCTNGILLLACATANLVIKQAELDAAEARLEAMG